MSILNQLASSLGRRDEVPNQLVAEHIVTTNDIEALQELVDNLANKELQNDCIKAIYEVGYRKPALIAPYADDFLDQLSSRNNRMVWGSMTALGLIADLQPQVIWKRIDEVITANARGSVITQDWGIRVLSKVAAKSPEYQKKLVPLLMAFLKDCPSKDIPKHLESIRTTINKDNSDQFISTLKSRIPELSKPQLKRVEKLIQTVESKF